MCKVLDELPKLYAIIENQENLLKLFIELSSYTIEDQKNDSIVHVPSDVLCVFMRMNIELILNKKKVEEIEKKYFQLIKL